MQKVQVTDTSGNRTKDVSLPEKIFSHPVNEHLIYEAAVNYQANQRQGTASTKVRGEVQGSTRKPWRQKGTGRARAGSIRSPLWRKGGTVFGPQPRDYSYKLPKALKANALKSALSLKNQENRILVLDSLTLAGPKTKEALKILLALKLDSALLVDSRANKNLFLAVRNIPKIKAVDPRLLTAFDVLKHNWLVMTEPALESLVARLQK
jgi:large subunit ribosomal protein L4